MKKNKFISLLGIVSLFAGVSSCTKINNNTNSSTTSSTTTSSSTSSSSSSTPDVPKEITTDENSFEYGFSNGKILLTGLKKDKKYTHIIIPDEIDGVIVGGISNGFLQNNESIRYVKLNKYISSLTGDYFYRSTNLKTIDVDNENNYFKVRDNCLISYSPSDGNVGYTFYFSPSIYYSETFEIPEYITTLYHYSLKGGLFKTLKIPATLTNIQEDAISYCQNLENYVVDSNNTKYQVLNNCLVSINTETTDDNITKTIKTVVSGSINSTIPTDPEVQIIGKCAFNGMKVQKEINIPANITSFKAWSSSYSSSAFEYSNVEKITCADNLTLDERSFNNCLTYAQNLREIEIPNGVELSNRNNFIGCISLEKVIIKGTLSTKNLFHYETFYSCEKPITFDFGTNNPNFTQDNEGNVLYTSEDSSGKQIKQYIGYFGEDKFVNNEFILTVPEGVTNIGYCAFRGKKITKINLPNSVTNISDYAFRDTNITNLTFPANIEKIGSGIFCGCQNLDDITWPSNINTISSQTFTNVKVKTIHIGANVNKFEDGLFASCEFENVYVDENNTTYASVDDRFLLSKDLKTLYGCTPDKNGELIIPNSVETIGQCACVTNATKITIGSKVSRIGYRAFYRSEELESIVIPTNVNSIADRAFEYCYKLSSIKFENPSVKLGQYLFSGCTSLKSIDLPENANLSVGMFQSAGLESFVVSYNCSSLPSGIFYASKLKTIEIKNPSTKINIDAFNAVNYLQTIIFNGTLEQFKTAFGATKEEYSKLISKSVTIKFKSSENVSEPDTTKTTDEIYAEANGTL